MDWMLIVEPDAKKDIREGFIEGSVIVVIAVMHTRREPGYYR